MTAKRALIVDDSKSARVVLSRMLEKHGIEADTCESAEAAIEFLKSHRPDVIFMDHLMPGMDGFQAVQAIKNNPVTATIPVMMYTSQEGELYVGQARALGAMGVLPKQVRSTDVSKVLYELRLLEDRREAGPSAFDDTALALAPAPDKVDSGTAPADVAAAATAAAVGEREVKRMLDDALREQSAELRRFVVASLDSLAHRIAQETRAQAQAALPPPPPPPKPAPRPWGWMIASAASLVAAVVLAFIAWPLLQQAKALQAAGAGAVAGTEGATSQVGFAAAPPAATGLPAATAAAVSGAPAAASPFTAGAAPAVAAPAPAPPVDVPPPVRLSYGYGEVPLSGARAEALRAFASDLERDGRRGVIRVATFSGVFCLVGNAAEGWSAAPPDLPANRCDQTANPYDASLRASQRQTPAVTSVISGVEARSGGLLSVDVAHQPGSSRPYPTGSEATAAQWNDAAAANQYVEIHFEPAQ